MITAAFYTKHDRILGFEVQGHSGYAPAGEDIVCAAVTSAVRLCECAINDILGLQAPVKLREENAFLSITLPAHLEQNIDSICQTLFAALMLHLVSLNEEYPAYISVVERDRNE